MNLPPINTILTFISVVEHGRFNKAASSLALTESAVSHQIRKLEDTLGVRLLDRGRSGPILTEAGQQFYLKSSIAVKQLQEVVQDLTGDTQTRIVVTLPPSLASLWLSSNLWSFYEINDKAEVVIFSTERQCNLETERIDMGIRFTNSPDWDRYESLRLWEEQIFPIMTPDKAAELEKKGWTEFSKDTWFVQNQMHLDECGLWFDSFGLPQPPANRLKTLNSFDQVVNAALTGQCVAMGRSPMVNSFIEDGRLVTPTGKQVQLKTGYHYYAVWPKQKRKSNVTEAFLNWLESHITK